MPVAGLNSAKQALGLDAQAGFLCFNTEAELLLQKISGFALKAFD